RTHTRMSTPGGVSLLGNFSSTQSALIVPQPCNDSLYYVFTTGHWGDASGLNYSIVNIKGNLGNGVVTSINNNLLPGNNSTEKLTYAHHGNGIAVWILTHGHGTNSFYAYQLNCEGILLPPVISYEGSVYSTVYSKAGYLEANPDGDLLAAAIYDNSVNSFEVFDFNNNTGVVGPMIGSFGSGTSFNYGVEFSPDGRQLYVSNFYSLWQIPVAPGSMGAPISIPSIGINSNNWLGAMQRGPDGKIYIARNRSTSIDVINNPNAVGPSCGYVPLSVPIAGVCKLGLPACYSKKCEDYLTQCCYLALGYSFMSSRIIPEDPDMLNILSDNLENLDSVRNTAGMVLSKIGPMWVNNIGDWITTEGYLFHMNAEDELCITGYVIDPQTPIGLTLGYQMISYLPEFPINTSDVFADVLINLDFVQNSQGQMFRKIGPNWVNGIGDMNPCEGYLVKMNAEDVLIYPETSDNLTANKTQMLEHYRVIDANPYDPVWTIYFEKGALNIGDEIGVYDGEILAGAGVVVSDNILENSIPVFSNLYKIGNYPIFKVWNKNEKEEFLLTDYSYINPYGDAYMKELFPETDGEYSMLNFSVTGISDNDNKHPSLSIYPNPSEGIFNILFDGVMGNVQIKIVDLQGNEHCYFVIDGIKTITTKKLDLSLLPAGIYFISIIGDNFTEVKKIVIQ
ncbi:MAG: T9SS type A sorting domain-containing protein, partial [Bacteroidales bacterium]|nr:T9SS type A sorting domain-containing protein [Bacteroidales bacterium]